MFLVRDKIEDRHAKIASFLETEPVIAVILAAVDFEWTLRRAIIGLGSSPNRHIRDEVLKKVRGIEDFKKAWKKEVYPRTGKRLTEVVGDWQKLKKTFAARNKLVHGIKTEPSSNFSEKCINSYLQATLDIVSFARTHKISIFGKKLPVRKI
jgi:hypothetical protein